ncbi:MAG: hypothetical protein PHT62_02375 [Desulfotomaculaceae bacterium]|nr:hypothetical protein [Desulfotomaculaceae bacterium]
MFTPGAMDTLLKQVISQLDRGEGLASQASPRTEQTNGGCAGATQDGGTGSGTGGTKGLQLSPQKILVVLGLLGGVLEVTSVLVDKDQTVQFVLSGTLKRPTRLDKMMNEIGKMPFDDVLKTVLDRLS